MRKFLILLLCLLVTFSLIACDSVESTVRYGARDLVKETLKTPSTAKFKETEILEEKEGKYLVKVVLDAENLFGAMVRSEYLVILQSADGKGYTYKKNVHLIEYEENQNVEDFYIMNDW